MGLGEVLLAIPLVLLKVFGFILVLVYIESSLAKLRLFRITEFLGAAFVISCGRDDHPAIGSLGGPGE